jgi:PAS domain S-box-containing protein
VTDTVGERLSIRSRIVPAAVLLGGIVASLALFLFVGGYADSKERDAFLAAARTHEVVLRRAISANLETLLAIRGLFDTSHNVQREEFEIFVSVLLERGAAVQALEWIPRVSSAERSAHEAAARAEGFFTYEVTERDSEGVMRRAGIREEYFPVYFIAPLEGNEMALGFDLASDPRRLAALQRSRDSWHPVATSRVTLVQDTQSEAGFLLYVPVHATDSSDESMHGVHALTGFVLGVYRIGDLVVEAGQGLPENVNLEVEDVTDPNAPEVLYRMPNGSVGRAPEGFLAYEAEIDVAGRKWRMVIRPAAGFFVQGLHFDSLVALILGVGLTLLLSYHIWKLQHTNALIADEVTRQTNLTMLKDRELIDERRHFEDVVQNQDEFIVRLLPDTTLTFVNSAFCKYYGKSKEQLLGTKAIDLVPAEERAGFLGSLETVREGEYNSYERKDITADGRTIWLQWHRRFIGGPDGAIREVQAVGRDISSIKRREQHLEQANEDLERFAYIASHDLREPLRKIEAANSILLEDLSDRLSDTERKWLRISSDGAMRMRAMIEDLLNLSRVEQSVVKRHDYSLDQPIQEALTNLAASIDETGASITYVKAPTVPIELVLVRQLFQNLISNAIKYRGDDQPIIRVEFEERETDWLVSVADNGIGIAAEYSERIFEIFKRLHGAAVSSGTGMGLAICRRIVERHGGRIWLDTRHISGSRFCFTLAKPGPVADSDEQEMLERGRDREPLSLAKG